MKSLQLNNIQKRENSANSDNGLSLTTDQGEKKFEQDQNGEYEDSNKKSSESSSNNDETVSLFKTNFFKKVISILKLNFI